MSRPLSFVVHTAALAAALAGGSLGAVGCATAANPLSNGDDASTPDASHTPADASSRPADSHQQQGTDAQQMSGSCAQPFSGVVGTWDLTGQTGSETSAPGTAATGGTVGAISRASGLTATGGTDSINSSNWSTSAAMDPTKYYTVTLTAPSGCALALTSASLTASKSGTGPAQGAIATSADNFSGTSTLSTAGTASTPSLSVSGETGTVEVRVYGWNATGLSGTLRISGSFTISGSYQ